MNITIFILILICTSVTCANCIAEDLNPDIILSLLQAESRDSLYAVVSFLGREEIPSLDKRKFPTGDDWNNKVVLKMEKDRILEWYKTLPELERTELRNKFKRYSSMRSPYFSPDVDVSPSQFGIEHLNRHLIVNEENEVSFEREIVKDVTLVIDAFLLGAKESWNFSDSILRHKDKSIAYLIYISMSGEENCKVAAVEILGHLKDERLIFLFLNYLSNSCPRIRYQAAKNIKMLGPKAAAALPILLQFKANANWQNIHFKWILDEAIKSIEVKSIEAHHSVDTSKHEDEMDAP